MTVTSAFFSVRSSLSSPPFLPMAITVRVAFSFNIGLLAVVCSTFADSICCFESATTSTNGGGPGSISLFSSTSRTHAFFVIEVISVPSMSQDTSTAWSKRFMISSGFLSGSKPFSRFLKDAKSNRPSSASSNLSNKSSILLSASVLMSSFRVCQTSMIAAIVSSRLSAGTAPSPLITTCGTAAAAIAVLSSSRVGTSVTSFSSTAWTLLSCAMIAVLINISFISGGTAVGSTTLTPESLPVRLAEASAETLLSILRTCVTNAK
mmetsp:Transcript_7508/g.22313  ORF Transcript_7508/g.22313 Transcript_7508/m.22313 type:complete len:264 (+) Transcript_7508:597-1388(+)